MREKVIGRMFLSISAVCVGIMFLSTGCATTKKVPPEVTSSLLGDACNKLTAGSEGQAGLRYVDPSADWKQYKKVLLDPVTFWGDEQTSLPAKDQQDVTDYFYQSLTAQLSRYFEIVTKPGPGVMRMTVAVTDVKPAVPVLRTISVIAPQARAVATLKQLATGSFPFVGEAQAEGKITDSVSGKLLSAAIDRRMGTAAVRAGFQWQLGDAENAIDTWTKRTAERLYSWTSGQETPA